MSLTLHLVTENDCLVVTDLASGAQATTVWETFPTREQLSTKPYEWGLALFEAISGRLLSQLHQLFADLDGLPVGGAAEIAANLEGVAEQIGSEDGLGEGGMIWWGCCVVWRLTCRGGGSYGS